MRPKALRWLSVLAAALLIQGPALAQQPDDSLEALWTIVRRQQAEIEALRAEVQAARDQSTAATATAEATDAKLEATGDYLDSLAVSGSSELSTTIGGYGELHYNNVDSDAGDSEEIDFHRFVLFFGHAFSDRVRFYSELELEHSLVESDGPGEVELEQAYVDFALSEQLAARTGLFLLPVGILNETHEPTTFYGVERNDVESIILPSTWWEAGAALTGHFGNGFSWDLAAHSGLAMPTEGSSAFRVRSGRQKVAEANASDLAYTARLRYTGRPGLELAASYQYQSDPSQVPGDGLDSGQLFTAHAVLERGAFGLRALYGSWHFSGAAVEAANADEQDGRYIEPSFRLSDSWGIYARHEDLDAARDQDRFSQNEIGLNYWPTDGVVLKLDVRRRDFDLPALAISDFTAVDLGFGYAF